ncbi:GlxA family transcriptional regulator [Robiginitomaculum antarcticum]|uniref:GlxA family transcriptional regulator n=1 Tax=Robiginitomaculum antarcticum TaxID=437507 RepID=UPI00036992AD|nr:DJ-1/PfpI family protein [Robiginitomaculum antarcticum]
MSAKRKIAVVVYDQVNGIDITGPSEAFGCVNDHNGNGRYEIEAWAVDELIVRTESGIRLCADKNLPQKPKADILIIPGGKGIRDPKTLRVISNWIKLHHANFDRVTAICTGSYALADSGLLDGRSITTHWAHAKDLGNCYPKVSVNSDALFIQEGRFYTSGGVTSGIDLALEIIEADFGAQTAMKTAKELVVFLKRPGNQAQFSLPLELQSGAPPALADTCKWAVTNLDSDLSVESLASHAGLSPRHFSRIFRQAFGMPPASFVKRLRLDAGRTLLAKGLGLERVAAATGFKTTDGFSRAFECEFKTLPSEYRKRFWISEET